MRSCDTISDRFIGSSRRDWLNGAKATNLSRLSDQMRPLCLDTVGGPGVVVDYNQIRDRFFEFEAQCREYAADANLATAEWFESMAEIFRKDGERIYRDVHIIVESLSLLARAHELLMLDRLHTARYNARRSAEPLDNALLQAHKGQRLHGAAAS